MKPDFKRRQSRTFPTNDTGTQEFVFVSGNPKKTYKPVRRRSSPAQACALPVLSRARATAGRTSR